MRKPMQITVDFDGTCVMHDYPDIGQDVPDAVRGLKELVVRGDQLILFTMRSGKHLVDAVNWFKDNDIPLYGIQKDPKQHEWTSSPKAYGHRQIDDAAVGCPLVQYAHADRPCVLWYGTPEHPGVMDLLRDELMLEYDLNGQLKFITNS